MAAALSVYFAGPLFSHKDLIGNALLASYIARASADRYVCVLPQDLEQTTARPLDIRNQDLQQVMRCDLALFNFDGSELDSGTVVEFMFAKFLDIPAVLLRSDFRAAGEQGKDGEAWNLMCAFYPRTRIVQFNAMAWYQQARQAGGTFQDILQRFYERIATAVVQSLDAVRHEPPLPKGPAVEVESLYRWALRFPGGGFEASCAASLSLDTLVAEKRAKGLV
ncbi:MAG TPA: nucleoside 2-deoxyribosyltransferase [Candidatus Tectomicrobia bacterium]|jgi:nucleoside 2-deoxyribosyltransferase